MPSDTYARQPLLTRQDLTTRATHTIAKDADKSEGTDANLEADALGQEDEEDEDESVAVTVPGDPVPKAVATKHAVR